MDHPKQGRSRRVELQRHLVQAALERLASKVGEYLDDERSIEELVGKEFAELCLRSDCDDDALLFDESLTPFWWPKSFWATAQGSKMVLSDADRHDWFVQALIDFLRLSRNEQDAEDNEGLDQAIARALFELHHDFVDSGVEALPDPFESIPFRPCR